MEEELEEDKSMDPDPGNEPAGDKKGDPEKIVPNRKDITGESEKVTEQDKDEEKAPEEEELDVDKEVKEDAGVGPGPLKAQGAMGKPGEGENDEVEEAFAIFKEQILEEEEEDDDEDVPKVNSDDIVV